MDKIYGNPPENTKRIECWDSLPSATATATYEWRDRAGNAHTFTVAKKMRRVLEGLMRFPMYCGSIARLSDIVFKLRAIHGVPIETQIYDADPASGDEYFGIYVLGGSVRFLCEGRKP